MPGITRKIVAQHVTITLVPLTAHEVTGVFTEATSFSFTGKAGVLTINLEFETEDYKADDADGANWVPLGIDFTVTMEALKHVSGTDLEDIIGAYSYGKLVVVTPKGTGTKTRTFWGLMQGFNWDKQRGRNADSVTLRRVDIGSANPLTVTA
jgi:hypothetical protein